jgi:hypothetical protein
VVELKKQLALAVPFRTNTELCHHESQEIHRLQTRVEDKRGRRRGDSKPIEELV